MSAPGKLLLAPIAAAFLVAGCAARVEVDGASFEKTEFSVYLDRGRRTGRSYDVLMTESGALRVGEEKVIRQRPANVTIVDKESIDQSLQAIMNVWYVNRAKFASFSSISEVVRRIEKEEVKLDSLRNPERSLLRYVSVRENVFRVGPSYASWKSGAIVDIEGNLLFSPAVPDVSDTLTAISLDSKFYAYAYCGESREEDDNRQCEMKIYEAGSPVALREEVFAGYVEDLAFSCDGTALYLLWKQIDIKQGPIDSLFAVAGHPNSDDDYLLSRYPLQGAAQVSTVKVARSDAGSSGTLVSTCPDGQTAQSR